MASGMLILPMSLQQRPLAQQVELLAGDADRPRQRQAVAHHPLRVAVRVRALGLDGAGEGEDDGLGGVALLDEALQAEQRAAAGDDLDEVERLGENSSARSPRRRPCCGTPPWR